MAWHLALQGNSMIDFLNFENFRLKCGENPLQEFFV
jgi:hypothetical protein